jgi:hypothetical protein
MRIPQWAKVDARWYLGVHCFKCEAPILFALDHSDGTVRPAQAGRLLLTCSRTDCGHKADYTRAKVSRFQKTAHPQNAKGRNS